MKDYQCNQIIQPAVLMTSPTPIDWTQPTVTILNQLLEIVERRRPSDKTRDDTAWVCLNRIAHVFDAATLSQMRQSLYANGYEDFYSILIGGDDFGKPKVQAILDALHQVDPQAFTAERIAIMRDWGVEARPRWTLEGFTTQPTIGDVDKRKADESEKIHRQKARTAGAQFGELYKHGDDAGAVMSNIWSAISGN